MSKWSWIGISFVLSAITYKLIEAPARDRRLNQKLVLRWIVGGYVCALATFGVLNYPQWTRSIQYRGADRYIDLDYPKTNLILKTFSTHPGCWNPDPNQAPFEACESQENLSTPNAILVLGDSHAASIIPGLIDKVGRERVLQRTTSGCQPTAHPTAVCSANYNHVYKTVNKYRLQWIILGGRYETEKDVDEVFRIQQRHFSNEKSKVIMLGPFPRFSRNGNNDALLKQLFGIYFSRDRHLLTQRLYMKPDPITFQIDKYARLRAKEWGMIYWSPVETFCRPEFNDCLVKESSDPATMIIWDHSHLTKYGSQRLVESNALIR